MACPRRLKALARTEVTRGNQVLIQATPQQRTGDNTADGSGPTTMISPGRGRAGQRRCMKLSTLCSLVWLTVGCDVVGSGSPADGFEPLFDGRTLDGWRGQDMSFWSVEDGAITGTISSEHAPKLNQYLIWQGGLVADFELKLTFRLRSTNSPGVNESGLAQVGSPLFRVEPVRESARKSY